MDTKRKTTMKYDIMVDPRGAFSRNRCWFSSKCSISKIRRNIRATSLMKLPIYIPRPYDRLTCVVTARISTHDSHCRPFTCTIVWNIRVFNDLLELHHLLRGTTWFRRQILHSSTITRSCLYLVAKKLPRCRMSRPVNNDFWNSWSVTFAHIRWKQG